MAGELYDVSILLEDEKGGKTRQLYIKYATKANFKRYKDTKTTNTFDGDITTGAYNTGADISFEGIIWPSSASQLNMLEDMLERDVIKTITITGWSHLRNGTPYKRAVVGVQATVSTDDEDWSPTDGMSNSLEFKVNKLVKKTASK